MGCVMSFQWQTFCFFNLVFWDLVELYFGDGTVHAEDVEELCGDPSCFAFA